MLRLPARELSREEILSEETRELIEHMTETMRHAPGVGLAAPQVGLSLQIAVIEDGEEYHKKFTAAQLSERERGSRFRSTSLSIPASSRQTATASSSLKVA